MKGVIDFHFYARRSISQERSGRFNREELKYKNETDCLNRFNEIESDNRPEIKEQLIEKKTNNPKQLAFAIEQTSLFEIGFHLKLTS